MFTRTFRVAALALIVAGCGGKGDQPAPNDSSLVSNGKSGLEQAEAQARSDAADNGMIDCATEGMTTFTRTCTVEREYADSQLYLTIRNDNGGFRRFLVMKDGSGVTVADGAEPAVVRTIGNSAIEVQVGNDKYRLPATVKGNTAPAAKP